jgi:hypothetical protein
MKANKVKVKRLQVKEGEGLHTHAVASEKEDIIVLDTNTDSVRFQVTETKSLVHEEHYPIPLEKGNYSAVKDGQQEFNYFTMNVRTVFD